MPPRINDAVHSLNNSQHSQASLPEPVTSKKTKLVRPQITMLGDGPLGTALNEAGLKVSELLVEQSAGSRTRRNQTGTNLARSGIAPSSRKALHQNSHVFILAENPLPKTPVVSDVIAYIGNHLQEGDLLLIERHSKPGDTESTHTRLAELRPDLVDSSSHRLLIDIAYVPAATPTSAQSNRYPDRLVGGVTPNASKRAEKLLRHVHSGPILTTDSRTVEEILAQHQRDSSTDRPKLSVIMPAFNASEYVNDSINSVLKQDLRDLELIVVDDGSTDATAAQVESLAERDRRITLIRTSNQGPGVARNRGIRAAHGRYLTFTDADDLVLPGAYSALVGSLEATSSEIATGTYVRIGPTGVVRPQVSERVHSRIRTGITLADAPELLEEPVVWNKVFRRELWNNTAYAFPDAANYEDQEPAYRALIGARSIDVLTRDVYAWRLPKGRSTRSRGQHRRRNLRARLEVVSTLERLVNGASPKVRERAYATWIGRDLMMHAEKVPEAKKKFFKLLSRAVSGLVQRMPYASWDLITAQERFLAYAVASGSLPDVEEILGTRAEETTAVPLVKRGGSWICAPTHLRRLRHPVPDDLVRARGVDFTIRGHLRSLEWIAPNQIAVAGYSHIPGINPQDTTVELVGHIGTREVFRYPTTRIEDQRAALDSNDPWHDIANSGFAATVFLPPAQQGETISLRVAVRGKSLAIDHHIQTNNMFAPAPAEPENKNPTRFNGYRWIAYADNRTNVKFKAASYTVDAPTVESVELSNDNIHLQLSKKAIGDIIATAKGEILHFRLRTLDASGAYYTAPAPENAQVPKCNGERYFTLLQRHPDGVDTGIPASSQLCRQSSPDRIRFSPDTNGLARLAQRAHRVTAARATVDPTGEILTIVGRSCPPVPTLQVNLTTSTTTIRGNTAVDSDGNFTADIPLVADGPEGSKVAVPSDGYFLKYDTERNRGSWLKTCTNMAEHSATYETPWATVRIAEQNGNTIAVTVSPPLRAHERTKYGQFKLRQRSWGPLVDNVVFESFNGKGNAGNTRALYEVIRERHPQVGCWWSVRDRATEIPSGAKPLVIGSEEWYRVLSTARIWINDNNFPHYVSKREGQLYLQVWHGTPLKKMLHDLPPRKTPLTYRRLMQKEIGQWDILLAQSTIAASRLRSSFNYEGRIHVSEYPKNHRLDIPREKCVRALAPWGIRNDTRYILYAPTWRKSKDQSKPDTFIDPNELARRVGRHVIFRAHHNARLHGSTSESTIDASDYPHVEDLMVISDVLITDYSSTAMDFALTNKPVIHYVPDLAQYKKDEGLHPGWAPNSTVIVEHNLPKLVKLVSTAIGSTPPQFQTSCIRKEADETAEQLTAILMRHLSSPK